MIITVVTLLRLPVFNFDKDAGGQMVGNRNTSSFKLGHLFLITTMVALMTGMRGCERKLYQAGGALDTVGYSLSEGMLVTYLLLIQSCAFAGGLVLAYEYFRHQRKLQHPGHWLIALAAVTHFGERAVYMTRAIHTSYGISPQYFRFYELTSAALDILVAVAWVAVTAFVAKRFGKLWLLTFGLLATLQLVTNFGWSLNLILAVHCSILIAILACVGYDLRKHVPRDWLHWFGAFFTIFDLVIWWLFHVARNV